MKRDPQAFLYDIIETADAVAMAVAGLALEDHKASDLICSPPRVQLSIVPIIYQSHSEQRANWANS